MKISGLIAVLGAFGLAACSGGGSGSGAGYGTADAKAGAAFRFYARDAFGGLNPVCPFTQNADLLAQYEPLRARYDNLAGQVEDTAFATDLESVQADYEYYWQQNSVDCGPMDTSETEGAVAREIERITKALGGMERAVGGT